MLYFYLNFKPSLSDGVTVELFDSTGKVVRYLTSNAADDLLEIQCSDLLSGTYFYRVYHGEQYVSEKVMIVK